jgi:probable HAF family extracellular repeat protein
MLPARSSEKALVPGFLYSAGTFTTLDDPVATAGTSASGINAAGQIVGSYTDGTGTHGFLYSAGTYPTLDDPMASSAAGGTSASAIKTRSTVIARSGALQWHAQTYERVAGLVSRRPSAPISVLSPIQLIFELATNDQNPPTEFQLISHP